MNISFSVNRSIFLPFALSIVSEEGNKVIVNRSGGDEKKSFIRTDVGFDARKEGNPSKNIGKLLKLLILR